MDLKGYLDICRLCYRKLNLLYCVNKKIWRVCIDVRVLKGIERYCGGYGVIWY